MYSNKRIMEAGEMRGHEMHLNIKGVTCDTQTPKYIIEENHFKSIYYSKNKTEHHFMAVH
jgi:hypothetical protein